MRNIKAFNRITGQEEFKDYPGKYDLEKIKTSGFLAQDVEKAATDSGYDFSGVTAPKSSTDLYSLSYEQFVVPLVKAIQEMNQKSEEQQKMIEQQNKIIAELKSAIELLLIK